MTTDPHRWHDDVLLALVRSFPSPPVYVEIGVASCVCFNKIAPYCFKAHAVDPSEHATRCAEMSPAVRTWTMASDDFFGTYLGHPDVVFIDGDHHYEAVKRDFQNALDVLAPGGTVAIHDVWPGSEADTRPEACGDVYRLVDEIRADSRLDTYLYATFPGLLLVQARVPIPQRWVSSD